MKRKTIKILTAVVLILTLVFSMNAVAFAGDDNGQNDNGEIQLRTIIGLGKTFVADSSTKATATVQASSSGYTPYIFSKMTLQSAALGSSNYKNVSGVDPSTKTVYDQTAILHTAIFPISSSKDYRVKIELTDEVNGVETTVTRYCYLSR